MATVYYVTFVCTGSYVGEGDLFVQSSSPVNSIDDAQKFHGDLLEGAKSWLKERGHPLDGTFVSITGIFRY